MSAKTIQMNSNYKQWLFEQTQIEVKNRVNQAGKHYEALRSRFTKDEEFINQLNQL